MDVQHRPSTSPSGPGERLRVEDAFFLANETAQVTQQVGGLALFAPGPVPSREQAVDSVRARLPDLPRMRQRLVPDRRGRLVWREVDGFDPDRQVRTRHLGSPGEPSTLDAFVAEMVSSPLDRSRPLWEMQVLDGLPDGRGALAFRMHHCVGDGLAVIANIAAMFDDASGRPYRLPDGGGSPPDRPEATRRARLAEGGRQARLVARGLTHLARAGAAPPSALNGPLGGSQRSYARVALSRVEVGAAARSLSVSSGNLVLGLVAEGLHHLLDSRGRPAPDGRLRVMVPRSMRARGTLGLPGNWTGSVPVDLPVGPLPVADRVVAVHRQVQRRVGRGEPEAARLVMHAQGAVPRRLQPRVARLLYGARWFNLVASYFPGPRQRLTFCGSPLDRVFPVLPLAERVGVTVGAMPWGDTVGIGVTGDAGLVPDVAVLADAVGDAFADLSGA